MVSSVPVEWIEFRYNNTHLMIDNFEFVQVSTLTALIDIKPDSPQNNVNPNSNAVVPVAVLSAHGLVPAQIDLSSVRFGLNGTEAAIHSSSFQDLNGDGVLDLVANFRIRQTGILCGTQQAWLSGQLVSGQQFSGSDSIHTVGCP